MSQSPMNEIATPNPAEIRPYLQNRELSWLDFNKRVLDQGADPTVPLLERLNFISIFWSNLQEFFMVRVGSLTDLALLKKTIIDAKSGMTPAEQLTAIYSRCHELYPYYEETYQNVRKLLAEQGIRNLQKENLSDEQRAYLREYMEANVLPFLSPQIVNARHPFPHLENGGLYIIVRLDDEVKPKKKKTKEEKALAKAEAKAAKNMGAEGVTLGIIPLPRQTSRVIELPGAGFTFMLIEHAIEMFAADIFSMYSVKHTNIVCVTRNADLDATEGADEQGEDYREHMKRILKKRSRLAPVRLESERPLSRTVKALLMDKLDLEEHQLFVTSVPLDMSYTWGLGGYLPAVKRTTLTQPPFTPQWPACLDRNRSLIEQVSESDVLLSYPYQSMDAFVQLLREAANDPAVVSIKITLYRLASQSHLAEALIAAAEAGKEVTALFELRARFDESNNIEWSQRFEQAGCHVIYGFRNYKVHSKICAITRQTSNGLQYITQLGTGNYNEKTAKLYTDFSFITADPHIGSDAMDFFRNMALENISDNYSILWVAPLMIKQNIIKKINEQIELARHGQPCGLFFKTNSITDKEIIDKIVEASQAGVETHLFVRGISCLLPGVPNYTENVREVSIVGRLLEHSRIYGFGPRESCKIYLSSADLMTRNMDKRIEIAWPVLNDNLRDQILGYLDICWSDTAKLRELLSDGSYTPLGFFAERDLMGNVELFNSQKYLIEEAQNSRLAVAELEAREESARTDRVSPVFDPDGVFASRSFAAPRAGRDESAPLSAVKEAAIALAASHMVNTPDKDGRRSSWAEVEAVIRANTNGRMQASSSAKPVQDTAAKPAAKVAEPASKKASGLAVEAGTPAASLVAEELIETAPFADAQPTVVMDPLVVKETLEAAPLRSYAPAPAQEPVLQPASVLEPAPVARTEAPALSQPERTPVPVSATPAPSPAPKGAFAVPGAVASAAAASAAAAATSVMPRVAPDAALGAAAGALGAVEASLPVAAMAPVPELKKGKKARKTKKKRGLFGKKSAAKAVSAPVPGVGAPPAPAAGSVPVPASEFIPGSGPAPRPAGPAPVPDNGPAPMPNNGPAPMPDNGPAPMPDNGPAPMPADGLAPMPPNGPAPTPAAHQPAFDPTLLTADDPAPMPAAGSIPVPASEFIAGSGPAPTPASEFIPGSGPAPLPASDFIPGSGPAPVPASDFIPGSGPAPMPAGGPPPAPAAGSVPVPASDFIPGSGPAPMPAGGPAPVPAAGSVPVPASEFIPGSGPAPLPASDFIPGTGPAPMPAGGSMPLSAGGPAPRPAGGQAPLPGNGPAPRRGSGPAPRPAGGVASPPAELMAELPQDAQLVQAQIIEAQPKGKGSGLLKKLFG